MTVALLASIPPIAKEPYFPVPVQGGQYLAIRFEVESLSRIDRSRQRSVPGIYVMALISWHVVIAKM